MYVYLFEKHHTWEMGTKNMEAKNPRWDMWIESPEKASCTGK